MWLSDIARVVQYIEGKQDVLITCEDITERIEAQNEKERSLKQLAETEKLVTLGQFTAAVTHEINNPLDIILTKLFHVEKCCIENSKHLNLKASYFFILVDGCQVVDPFW